LPVAVAVVVHLLLGALPVEVLAVIENLHLKTLLSVQHLP
jgi:hypothetical protein